MNILIAYDVATSDTHGAKRLRHVAKICKNYGRRVQNSLFECQVEPAMFISIRNQLLEVIDQEEDNIRIYHLSSNYLSKVEAYGKVEKFDFGGEFIV